MTEATFNITDFHYGSGKNVVMYYKGPFDKELLNIFGKNIRKVVGGDTVSGTKLFKVFIEMAQNISHYSSERMLPGKDKGQGAGSLALIDCTDHYHFVSGNLIRDEHIEAVMERCRLINSLDRDKLRMLKREHLADNPSGREGADIGLIQLAITSKHPLEIKTVRVKKGVSFITVSVKLDK